MMMIIIRTYVFSGYLSKMFSFLPYKFYYHGIYNFQTLENVLVSLSIVNLIYFVRGVTLTYLDGMK